MTSIFLTSNHHNDNVILNSLLRTQITDNSISSHSSTVEKLYKSISPILANTIIQFQWLKTHHRDFQCLLESIADYLLEGWWKETTDGVMFLDKSDKPNSALRIYHFRSSNVMMETDYLKKCWNTCLLLLYLVFKPILPKQLQTNNHRMPSLTVRGPKA